MEGVFIIDADGHVTESEQGAQRFMSLYGLNVMEST